MSIICNGLIFLAVLIGLFLTYTLCKSAGDADRTMEELWQEQPQEPIGGGGGK
jgi:hypothetical protein